MMLSRWDRIGISLSGLCIIHCLCLPLAIIVAPAIGSFFLDDYTHVLLFFLILISVGAAFIPGYQLHRKLHPIACAFLGFSLIAFATFFSHSWFGHAWESPIAICGSLFLIFAHWLNHRSKHLCAKCKHH